MMRRRNYWPLAIAALAALAIVFLAIRWLGSWGTEPTPETIAQASLESMRDQQRLTTFSAQYAAVVTSSQDRLGGILSAEKTLIMQGDVRYEIDLAKLDQDAVSWDRETETLSITLPAIEISEPQIKMDTLKEYRNGSVLFSVTNAEDSLDEANRGAAVKSISEQARGAVPMRLARENAKRAVARSFAMPLRAAGIEANVEVRFAGEKQDEPSYMDLSRPVDEVLREAEEKRRKERSR